MKRLINKYTKIRIWIGLSYYILNYFEREREREREREIRSFL